MTQERRLWLAVIDRARQDAEGVGRGPDDPPAPQLRAEVLEWVGTPGFEIVCEMAALDEDRVAARLYRVAGVVPEQRA